MLSLCQRPPNPVHVLFHFIRTPPSEIGNCCRYCSVAQLLWLFATPRTAARQASLSFTISWSSLRLMSMESAMPSNHLILCRPLLLLPSIFTSIRVFSNELVLCIRWPKYWRFSFSISPSKEYSGLISFRMDLLDLLSVQGTLKSFLQHCGVKSINSLALSLLYSPTLTSVHDCYIYIYIALTICFMF